LGLREKEQGVRARGGGERMVADVRLEEGVRGIFRAVKVPV
jgi:hypothetical protein